MSADISNEEIMEIWLEVEKDIYKLARTMIAYAERHNMHPGIIPNHHSEQFTQVCLPENI